jgi:hypothetical protein
VSKSQIAKIEFFVPAGHSEPIRAALGEAGFGHIGRYSHCAAETRVTGRWKPLEGAESHTGRVGEMTTGEEVKVEFLCRAERAAEAVRIIRRLHPYEEPLIMIIPLLNSSVEGSTQEVG